MAAVSTGMGHQGIVPAGGAGTGWRTGTRLPVGSLGRIHKKVVQGLSGAVAVARTGGLTDSDSAFVGCPVV